MIEAESASIFLTFFDSALGESSRLPTVGPVDHVVVRHKMLLAPPLFADRMPIFGPWGWNDPEMRGAKGGEHAMLDRWGDRFAGAQRPDVLIESRQRDLLFRFYHFKGGREQRGLPVLGPFSVVELTGLDVRGDGALIGHAAVSPAEHRAILAGRPDGLLQAGWFWRPLDDPADDFGPHFDIAVWTSRSKENPTAFLDRDRLAQSPKTMIERMEGRMRLNAPALARQPHEVAPVKRPPISDARSERSESPQRSHCVCGQVLGGLLRCPTCGRSTNALPLTGLERNRLANRFGPSRGNTTVGRLSDREAAWRLFLRHKLLTVAVASLILVYLITGTYGSSGAVRPPATIPVPVPTVTAVPTATSVTQGNRPPTVGQEGRINVESPLVYAATTQENYDAFGKALTSNDRIGVANLTAQGRVILIDNGTRVLVLDRGGFFSSVMQVRILEGRYFGLALWLPAEFVTR